MALRGTRRTLAPVRGRRRTPDQAFFARTPGLYRLIARGITLLPPRSRLRGAVVTRTTRLAYAATSRRDFAVVLPGLATDFEYRPSKDLMPPDLEPVFRGHEGYLDLWRYWLDAFGDIHWEPEEMLDFGHALLVTTQQMGSGSGSGVAVSERVFQLFTLHNGLVIRQEDFSNFEEALRAAA
jgi:SnoaL-like protein